MLETNEEYLTQEELDSILSATPPKYKPTQKELETIILYDSYYIACLWHLLFGITCAAREQSFNKKYGREISVSYKMSLLKNVNEKIEELRVMKGRKIKKNPKLRDLTMSDFKSELFDLQYLLKEIKKCGGCPKFIKSQFKQFGEFYKAIQEPIVIKSYENKRN